MRKSTLRWLPVALAVGIATPLVAQEPHIRSGFWVGLAATLGFAHPTCDGCGSRDWKDGYGLTLKLGLTLSQNFLVGIEFNDWRREDSDVTTTMGNGNVVLYFYPSATGRLFVKGGGGASIFEASGSPGLSGLGWGWTAGVGYDIRAGSNFSLTPVVNFWYGHVGDLDQDGGTVITGWKQSVIELGLGLTYH